MNNAGIVSGTTLLDTPDSKIIKTFEVNALAHFWTIKVKSQINRKQKYLNKLKSFSVIAKIERFSKLKGEYDEYMGV